MNLKTYLFDDDRGVSPVIGVILMVAITVILAAVVATFVMNMGPNQSSPANAQLDWTKKTQDGGSDVFYQLSMTGGEALPTGEYQIEFVAPSLPNSPATKVLGTISNVPKEMTAGDSVNFVVVNGGSTSIPGPKWTISSPDPGKNDVTKVRLIWKSPSSDNTQIVETWEP